MKIQEVLDKTTKFFKEKKFDSPRLDAELLISSALKLRRLDLYLKFDQPIAEAELENCRSLVKRRSSGEPVAYILGRKDFFGIEFLVDSRVLIPRPETEMMVEQVLAWIKEIENPKMNQQEAYDLAAAEKAARLAALNPEGQRTDAVASDRHPEGKGKSQFAPLIVDFGCGSGCISLSLLAKHERASAQLVDASEEALQVSRENAHRLNVQDRCQFIFQRVQTANVGEADFVVANPPYISSNDPNVEENVRAFEPHSALFAENEGFQEIHDWAAKAHSVLKVGGRTIFEIGMTQAAATMARFQELGFHEIQVHRDLSGKERFISGRK